MSRFWGLFSAVSESAPHLCFSHFFPDYPGRQRRVQVHVGDHPAGTEAHHQVQSPGADGQAPHFPRPGPLPCDGALYCKKAALSVLVGAESCQRVPLECQRQHPATGPGRHPSCAPRLAAAAQRGGWRQPPRLCRWLPRKAAQSKGAEACQGGLSSGHLRGHKDSRSHCTLWVTAPRSPQSHPGGGFDAPPSLARGGLHACSCREERGEEEEETHAHSLNKCDSSIECIYFDDVPLREFACLFSGSLGHKLGSFTCSSNKEV